ncbi:hypothetical protein CCPUN_08020 [Cardinium endosymbiont of Culicoides punctatus]|nr:hypothetical protein CCPUN_08020 [Cardinium endosymbiont of Culicoides punctatus]
MVTKIVEKVFVGKDIRHVSIYRKGDTRRCYNMIYVDGATGIAYAKRFQILGITRDKTYDLTLGTPGSRIIYLSEHPNGEAELLTILLSPMSRASKKKFTFNFAQLAIKGRAAKGNILTKHTIYKAQLKEQGISTLEAIELWYDERTGRITPNNGRGQLLGSFGPSDKLLLVFKEGYYLVTDYPLSFQLDPDAIALVEKLGHTHLLSIIFYHRLQKKYFVKRFMVEGRGEDKKYPFFSSEADMCDLTLVTSAPSPKLALHYLVHPTSEQNRSIIYDLEKVAIKTIKAKGIPLSKYTITQVNFCHE